VVFTLVAAVVFTAVAGVLAAQTITALAIQHFILVAMAEQAQSVLSGPVIFVHFPQPM
jgi:hypothetical protein